MKLFRLKLVLGLAAFSKVVLVLVAIQTVSAFACVSDHLDLSGEWRICLDPKDVGEAEQWFAKPLANGQAIALPNTTDLAGLGHPLDHITMTYGAEVPEAQFSDRRKSKRADEAGHLVRERWYLGLAWYQREVTVPPEWQGKHVQLRLERVIWRTKVWLDDQPIGSNDSLVSEHRYDLGMLTPGKHRLSVCVDNRQIHPIGVMGHAYGPETQSRWNGIVGAIELVASAPVFVRRTAVYPAADQRRVEVKLLLANAKKSDASGTVAVVVRSEQGNEVVGSVDMPVSVPPGDSEFAMTVPITKYVQAWDEFHPVRYVAEITLNATHDEESMKDASNVQFGFRVIERDGREIKINGRRIFLRGTLDCCVYPKTGHPPMDVDQWLQVLGVIQAYGFNHVRYHTWCPPEAAFEAADRLGLYLAPETPFWVDGWITKLNDETKPLGQDPMVTTYIRNEIRRISDAYGNHPSFAFFCIGNEMSMSTDWEVVEHLLAEAKQYDSRRLYCGSTARKRVESDDYVVTTSIEKTKIRGIGPPHTNWDFQEGATSIDLPLIAHETGQRPVFPDYDALLPKFTGPLQPYNFVRLRDQLAEAGLIDQVQAFERASAKFQLVQYKAEHEAMLRTRAFAGYQLLMLNDFTGQTEAVVGILDPFWESKGVVRADDVRQWNAPTTPLARFDRFLWTTDEVLQATLEVAHYGAHDLEEAVVNWQLTTSDESVVASGQLPPRDIPTGTLTHLGSIEISLKHVPSPAALDLRIRIGEAENRWKIWVYPPKGEEQETVVVVAHSLDDATQQALREGRRVLLLVHGLRNAHTARTRFPSVYWSAAWWGGSKDARFASLGILCDPMHPALAAFPNDGHSDWQWYELTEGATTLDLTNLAPQGFRPIVQPVTDHHHNRLLAQVFEVRVGEGRLLVCGYDLDSELEKRHAARQLRHSLLQYMQSKAFNPDHAWSRALCEQLLME